MEEFLNSLNGKKIAILGFAREGKSTYRFLRKKFKDIYLCVIDENIDLNSKENEIYTKDKNLNIIKTHDYIKLLKDYDYIFKSPGISFKGIEISDFKDKIVSQLDLFLKYTKSFTIGVTGTKGKSTTCTLIYNIIKDQNKNVHFVGNIGKPIFDEIEYIKDDDIVVIEISSHQSQYIQNSPNIAVILNVFEEHLDHYNSYEEYIDAKLNVIRFQNEYDYCIYSKDNLILKDSLNNIDIKSHVNTISLEDKNKYTEFNFNEKRELLGEHNNYNIMVCLIISRILKLDMHSVSETIYKFKPLEHRMEKVGTFNDITYYNDSIATIPEATISCIETLKDVNTLIIGGLDRGIDYTILEDYLVECKIQNILCMYSTGKKIYDKIKEQIICDMRNIEFCDTLEEAVKRASKITKKGTICLLSPASASYGDFKNFEDRGNKYKEYIKIYN